MLILSRAAVRRNWPRFHWRTRCVALRMAKSNKTTHGVGTDQGGGSKAPRKEDGGGGRGARKDSASRIEKAHDNDPVADASADRRAWRGHANV